MIPPVNNNNDTKILLRYHIIQTINNILTPIGIDVAFLRVYS
jgi:hypothetical protein